LADGNGAKIEAEEKICPVCVRVPEHDAGDVSGAFSREKIRDEQVQDNKSRKMQAHDMQTVLSQPYESGFVEKGIHFRDIRRNAYYHAYTR
jgi:hypothetical protein